MTFKSRLIAFGIALFAANYLGAAYGQSALGLQTPTTVNPVFSDPVEMRRIDECMTVPIDQLSSNAACVQTLAKINITPADIAVIRDCKALRLEQVARDQACVALDNKHPEIGLLPR
jgi:hypothetical protein